MGIRGEHQRGRGKCKLLRGCALQGVAGKVDASHVGARRGERDPSSRGSIDASASFIEASAPKTTTPGRCGRGGSRVEGKRGGGTRNGIVFAGRGWEEGEGKTVVGLRPPFPPLEPATCTRVFFKFFSFGVTLRGLRGF